MRTGRLDEAGSLLAESLGIRRAALDPAHPNYVRGLQQYVLYLMQRESYAEAEGLLRESIGHRQSERDARNQSIAGSLSLLGAVLPKQGQAVEAESFLRESLDIRRHSSLPPNHWLLANTASALGGCLLSQGRYDEAEPFLIDSYGTLRRVLTPVNPRRGEARDRLIALYEATGRAEDAAAIRADEAAKTGAGDDVSH